MLQPAGQIYSSKSFLAAESKSNAQPKNKRARIVYKIGTHHRRHDQVCEHLQNAAKLTDDVITTPKSA